MDRSAEEDETALREGLRVIGLSGTEVDTYLALLKRGEATTRTVADDVDVTQRAVYDITERLENRGLVRVNDHASPTTIRALPPSESIRGLTDQLESIRPSLEDRFTETAPQAPEIQVVKTRETALKRVRSAISEAEHEILLSIPESIYAEIEPDLRAAVKRGVLVLLVIGEASDIDGNGARFAGSVDVVRYWNESLTFLYAVDGETAMVGDPALLSGTHADEEGIVVSQQNLVGSISGLYLSGYWPASTEAFVTDPQPLPQTFEWFRQALIHATLYRRQGTNLWADVVTTDGRELTGSVAQVRQALIEPATNEFTLQASLSIETDTGTVTIGGPGSFVEDYEARSVTLRSDP